MNLEKVFGIILAVLGAISYIIYSQGESISSNTATMTSHIEESKDLKSRVIDHIVDHK